MEIPSSANIRWYGLVAGLAAVLVLLAFLQYRSSQAVSKATAAQMRTSLVGSLMDVREGLERELTALCRELQFGSGPAQSNNLEEYAAHFESWRQTASHPDLVADIYIWERVQTPNAGLVKLNSTRSAFQPADWPQEFGWLHQRLLELNPGPGPMPPDSLPSSMHRRSEDGLPPNNIDHAPRPPEASFPNRPRPPEFPGPFPQRSFGAGHFPSGGPGSGWMIEEDIPALVGLDLPSSDASKPSPPRWIIIVLNREVLFQHVIPDLVQRYFGGSGQSSYQIAVIDRAERGALLYVSDPGFSQDANSLSDAAITLFGPSPPSGGMQIPPPGMEPSNPPQPTLHAREDTHRPNVGFHEEDSLRFDPQHDPDHGPDWEIIAKHREGSVEAAVAILTRRNLMFNFAVLIVLAATMGTIIVASQRARRLGQLQMDFVANVSHELRTPLTGIISAAQNIADGVIDDKERTARYGRAIVGQAQQLTELVEQILLFSATQNNRHRYHFQPVDIAEVLEASIDNLSGVIRSAGIQVDQEVQPGLPRISGDFKALSQCLQNLIANAVKYGDGRWIGVRALAADLPDGRKEIRISIADRGMGISRADLAHIFEPFYRSPEVTAAQIHGSGLGLPLARSIAEAMGGSLSVQSAPQQGSTFTLHLPLS